MNTLRALMMMAFAACAQLWGPSANAMGQALPEPSYYGYPSSVSNNSYYYQNSSSDRPVTTSRTRRSYRSSSASLTVADDDCPTSPRRRGANRNLASDLSDVGDAISASAGGSYGAILRGSCRVGNRGFGMHHHPIHGGTRMHTGQDLPASQGTPVYAPADGTVIAAGQRGGYGNMVSMRLANGLVVEFAHLSRFGSSGTVRKGQIVGYVGMTGTATGPHLHLQVKKNGKLVNPRSVFSTSQMCSK